MQWWCSTWGRNGIEYLHWNYYSSSILYISLGYKRFRSLINLQKYIKAAAQIMSMWKSEGRCSKHILAKIYNSFDICLILKQDTRRNRNMKTFKQQSWYLVYRKLKKMKNLLVGENSNNSLLFYSLFCF